MGWDAGGLRGAPSICLSPQRVTHGGLGREGVVDRGWRIYPPSPPPSLSIGLNGRPPPPHRAFRTRGPCPGACRQTRKPALPAAIPLPRLPVPALKCFSSILNRLIEQCSGERAACQSRLKTQKQKIKKAHG